MGKQFVSRINLTIKIEDDMFALLLLLLFKMSNVNIGPPDSKKI